MDVGFLKRQIKERALGRFYIFTGDEQEVQRVYINKIGEVTNKQVAYIDSVSEALNRQSSLFSTSKCYVCRDDSDFMKAEKSWEGIEKLLGDNMLIILLTNLDKRTKFYKHFSDLVVVFDYMNIDLVTKYLIKKGELSEHNARVLADICECDYGKALLELDKVLAYKNKLGCNVNSAFTRLLNDGAIHIPPEDAIFDWCDSVLKRDPRAFDLLQDCYAIGEPSLRLLLVLYNNAKKVLQVQSCKSRNVAESTGLTDWEVKTTRDKLNYWSIGELVSMLKLIDRVENNIKKGLIDSEIAVDYVMTKIFE